MYMRRETECFDDYGFSRVFESSRALRRTRRGRVCRVRRRTEGERSEGVLIYEL